jgi:hypothetical protein
MISHKALTNPLFQTYTGDFLKNIILITCILIFLPSCTHIGGLSHDTEECRAIAYDKNIKLQKVDAEIAFSQCLAQKKNLREQKTTQANINLWGEFITDLLSNDTSKKTQ